MKDRTNCTSTPVGRRDLSCVGRRRHDHDLDTETKHEATDDKVSQGVGSGNHNRSDDNDPSSNKHALATAESVGDDGRDGGCDHGATDLLARNCIWAAYVHCIQRGDDGDLLAGLSSVEGVLVVVHGEDRAHQRACTVRIPSLN